MNGPPKPNVPVPVPVPNGAALIKSIQNLNENWLVMLELYEHQARVIKVKYDLAIALGFSEPQALHLCNQSWS